MVKILLLYLIFVLASQISNDAPTIHNRLNLLSFSNNQTSSLFPILQWCSLIKIYTLYPSTIIKKNFKTGTVPQLDYFLARGCGKKSQVSLISEQNDLEISKTLENLIYENLTHFYFDNDLILNRSKSESDLTKDNKDDSKGNRARSPSESALKPSICSKELSSVIQKLMVKYRGRKERSKLFGILINRICNDLKTIGVDSYNQQIHQIIDFFNFASKKEINVDFAEFLKVYYERKAMAENQLDKTPQNSSGMPSPERNSTFYTSKSESINQLNNLRINPGNPTETINNDSKNVKTSQQCISHDNCCYKSAMCEKNTTEGCNDAFACPNSPFHHLSNFFDSLFFIYDHMFDFALNENINASCDQSLICLKLFSDCNLLIHLFLFIINSKNTKKFCYFFFNMEESVVQILKYFENLDNKKKIEFLVNNSKTFQQFDLKQNGCSCILKYLKDSLYQSQKFQINSAAILELHLGISRILFLQNFANSLALATIDPLCWEPPNLEF